MFRSEIIIDSTSYLELVGRRSGAEPATELLALTMRGQNVTGQATLASVSLTREEVAQLQAQLSDWLGSLK